MVCVLQCSRLIYRDTFLLHTFKKNESAVEAASDPKFLNTTIEIACILLHVGLKPPYISLCKSMQAFSSFLTQK
jgi:hypothetical protein